MSARLFLGVFIVGHIASRPCLAGDSKAATEGVIIDRDIEYARPDGISLQLDVIRPVTPATRTPVVVFVHGGGWKNGDKKSGHKQAAWLVPHGFAVVTINYRLTDVAQWPAQIEDCCEAVRWVRRNADQYGFDPDHVAAWGTSAGGHLVALMGTRPRSEEEAISSQVQAVCDWFGPSDLMSMPPNNTGNGRTAEDVARSNGAKLLGVTVREDPARAHDASGLHHVSADDCPFLIMHGSKDPGVPLDQSRRLHERLRQHGVESQLHIVDGAGHGGPLFQTERSRYVVLDFFNRTLKDNWPAGSGPRGDFSAPASFVSSWDLNDEHQILWRKSLPETGQSTVVVWDDRCYFTTMTPVAADAQLGADIIAWCCDAHTGETLWQRTITGSHPLRLSGCFSDSTAPPPVTDGRHTCFFNASGGIACFDRDGRKVWSNSMMPVGRSQPFLHQGQIIFTRQKYMPVDGHFTHEHKNAPPDQWTNLQALSLATGAELWSTTCGVNMGCVPLPMQLKSGRGVAVVGRGGGHSPPETPEGISLVDLTDGATIWTLPLPGYMSTQTFSVRDDTVFVFHKDEHLWVDALTGEITRRASLLQNVPVYDFAASEPTLRSLPSGGKRNIIQQSNLLAGDFHYFRSYLQPCIGRVNIRSGQVEYKHVPIQCRTRPHDAASHAAWLEASLWSTDDLPADFPADKRERIFRTGTLISYVGYEPNHVQNSRGLTVMGDDRSQGNGWGHHASAVPTSAGGRIHMPIMSGMVYSLDATDDAFAARSPSISFVGPVNHAWNRSSLSFAHGRVYAHTISEILCLQPATAASAKAEAEAEAEAKADHR